jgi:hypothetical protein
MEIIKFDFFYIKNNIIEHDSIKKPILDLINKIPCNRLTQPYENIFHTDWNLPADFKREYLDYFLKYLEPYLKKISNFLKMETIELHNFWFQQYKKQNFHDWHIHPGANYSNIYYLELPKKNMATKFFNQYNNKYIEIEIKEGDLLTFPACVLHCSDSFYEDATKTIISFNSSFDRYIKK